MIPCSLEISSSEVLIIVTCKSLVSSNNLLGGGISLSIVEVELAIRVAIRALTLKSIVLNQRSSETIIIFTCKLIGGFSLVEAVVRNLLA